MSIRSKGLVFAMEDDLQEEVPVEMVPETAAEVEAGAAEMTEQSGEVEELVAATEEAEADAEALGDIQEVMAESVEQGEGLDETAAQIAEVAVESICARLGIRNSRVIPATESFGAKSSRVAATKIAMENIGETIKKIWEAIKSAMMRVWEKIKSFFVSVTKNTQQLSKHLESLKDRARSLDDSHKPRESELSNESIAKAFSVKKKADLASAKVIIANSAKLLVAAEGLASDLQIGVERVGSLLVKPEVSAAEIEAVQTEVNDVVGKHAGSLMTIAAASGDHVKTDKKSKVAYHGMFASTRVLALSSEEKEFGGEKFTETRIFMTTLDSQKADKIKALNKNEMGDLLALAMKLVDDLDAYEKAQAKIGKLKDAVVKAADVAMKELGKLSEGSTEKTRAFKKMSSQLNDVNRMTADLGVSIPKAVFDAAKFAGDYVSASIANYGSKK